MLPSSPRRNTPTWRSRNESGLNQKGFHHILDCASLFADGRSLLGGLRQRMEALTAAVEAAEPEALGQALERSIELHADGRPYVDRYHLRLAAKKLNAIVQALTLTLTLTLTLALILTFIGVGFRRHSPSFLGNPGEHPRCQPSPA